VTRHVRFRPQAEAEVLEVRSWYEERRRGLGAEFGAAVDNLVGRIAENPEAFPRAHGDVRRAILHRFPYAIYFRSSSDDIIVLAVHGRQHPRRWQSRV
jgi:plasmid stabilization system protein ParE